MNRYIWIKGKKYYYYGSYDSWKDAYNTARYYHRRNKKCKYFIQITEAGYLFPYKRFKLYLTGIIKMGGF